MALEPSIAAGDLAGSPLYGTLRCDVQRSTVWPKNKVKHYKSVWGGGRGLTPPIL